MRERANLKEVLSMWQVILTKKPTGNVFRDDYFPRKVYYKKEAKELQAEVRRHDGDARIEHARIDQ